jgi:FRG domain
MSFAPASGVNMTEIYRAENVEAAVEMAERFKDEGLYDWFRGQTQAWPPYSAYVRLGRDLEKRKLADERVDHFSAWLANTSELHAYADIDQEKNLDTVTAIMQHYGIPTNYIDFTTDPGVAGFFAADPPPEDGTTSCLYCLDTKELLSVWDTMREFREGGELQLVTIDVTNLWRLQAQRGVFLFCNYNWDVDFPMDRILFPTSGYPPYPTKDLIYPVPKSPLELVLDRYFDREAKLFGQRELDKIFDSLQAEGRAVFRAHYEAPPGFYEPQVVKNGQLDILESWSAERLAPWLSFEDESLRDVGSPPVPLRVNSSGPEVAGSSVAYGVGRLLRSDPDIRRKTPTWQLQGITDGTMTEGLASLLGNVWNGMRWLPYSAELISQACGTATALFFLGLGKAESREVEVCSNCFGPCIEVEFGATDSSSSRAYVAKETLLKAVRPDIADLLVDEHKSLSRDPRRLLQVIYSPSRLFEFDAFVRLFAREVIPSQALMRKFQMFSPAVLQTFGLP